MDFVMYLVGCVRSNANENQYYKGQDIMSFQRSKVVYVASKLKIHCSRSRSPCTLWWYSRVTESGVRRLICGLVKQTQSYVRFFIALRSQKGAFKHRTTYSFESVCVPLLVYGRSWILGNDWKSAIRSASSRDGIFAKSLRCGTSRQSAQLWNSQSSEYRATSPLNWMISPVLVWTCAWDVPGNYWQYKLCWL